MRIFVFFMAIQPIDWTLDVEISPTVDKTGLYHFKRHDIEIKCVDQILKGFFYITWPCNSIYI
jgi:hypothetical protein